ncbi:MAG: protein kinase [Phycisphaerales bacterium]|nr:protein kinase [Phycisphaerales bacterium]
MSTVPAHCLSVEVLETLAARGAGDQEMQAHLSVCVMCRDNLARIRADNEFLARFAAGGLLPLSSPAGPVAAFEIPGYEIKRELTRGGQGVVYLAVQRSTMREVAIKVTRQGPGATLADRTRFDREVELLGRLNHPNIVAVHDAGVVAGCQYFVMNYVDGVPLDEALAALQAARVATHASVPPTARATSAAATTATRASRPLHHSALELFIKVCDAVHVAHLRGVIHRDLKPSNIRVDRRGEPFVLDFGLAKTLDASADSAMTRTGQFVGSLPWASPEQVEGASARVDLRTDVYSLGVLLFQLLTGELPFDPGSNLRTAVDSILHRDPPRPSVVAAARGGLPVDDELDTIVLKCLAKERDRRYHIAGELARDLRRYLAGEAIEAKRDSATYMLRKTLQRYRWPVAFACVGVVLLTLFGGVMAVLYRHTAVLEAATGRQAQALALALSKSTIERARLLGAGGNMSSAEALLWRESRAHLPDTPVGRQVHWALWELYARNPCVGTWVSGAAVPHLPGFGPDGTLRCVDSAGRVLTWSLAESAPTVAGVLAALPNVPVLAVQGDTLLVRDGALARSWNLRTGHRGQEYQAGDEPLTCLAQSADGARVALGTVGGTIHLFDTASATLLHSWVAHGASLGALCFSVDGNRLYSCGYDLRLCVWDGRSGAALEEQPITEPQPRVQIGNLTLCPDGTRLALSLRWSVLLFDAQTLAPQEVLGGSLGAIQRLAFTSCGRWLAAAGADKRILIWDLETAAVVRVLAGHAGAYTGLAFSPDGAYLASAATDRMLRVWETGLGSELPLGVAAALTTARAIQEITVAPDGTEVLAAGEDGVIWAWNLRRDGEPRAYRGHTDVPYSVAFAPDGRHFASCANDGNLRIWDRAVDTPAVTINLRETIVRGAAGNGVRPYSPQRVAYAPDGVTLAIGGDDGMILLWDVAAERVRATHAAHRGRITALLYTPAGTELVSASMDGSIAVWDARDFRLVRRIPAHVGGVRTLALSRDGRSMVSGGVDATVRRWESDTGVALWAASGHQQDVFAVRFSPDGTLVASGERGQVADGTSVIILWDAENGSELLRLARHADMVFALDFSPDGRYLVSGSRDQQLQVHDLQYFERHITGNAAVLSVWNAAAGEE